MTDLILIAALVALIGLARAYVWACDALAPEEDEDAPTPRAAAREAQPPRAAGTVAALPPLPLLATVGAANWAGLAIAVLLFAYLLFTLLAPERFK